MLYFAYGSNMDWNLMRRKCPSSRFFCRALLDRYKLVVARQSSLWKCGVFGVIPEEKSQVWGVIYEISPFELGKLDVSEEYDPLNPTPSCQRKECLVYKEGDNNYPLTVFSYFPEVSPNPPPLSIEYINKVISGAHYWHLPKNYIASLNRLLPQGPSPSREQKG
ncbi:gamma-glutamylcyclotransferase [Candidatus Methylacidiphilum infernorum]|uniref:Gamma-glutamylcyclotransferase n=1 Tax=Candidatus Methylacidiphilum infernorum TaxID=511746 RepID=A0ABX7PU45_9BACT|nr:gamma-glutamylcyclotransferase family protein [Candidatus Methylacidiphilum infernorum]QSR86427.1 gamma-glutamylcyclotransferase [Candidatus Methylacidiphilum infernorum]